MHALMLPIIGALAGAGIGAGVNKENRLRGALIGGALGGLGGYGLKAKLASSTVAPISRATAGKALSAFPSLNQVGASFLSAAQSLGGKVTDPPELAKQGSLVMPLPISRLRRRQLPRF